MDLTYFTLQMHIWGAAAGGDILDFTAMLCEEPRAGVVHRWQDRTERDLGGEFLNDRPVPLSWALPGVTEIRLREARAAA